MPMIRVARVRRGESTSRAMPKSVSSAGGAPPGPGGRGGVQQDVLRLDVAVHDARGVRGGQRVRHVGGDRDGGLGQQPAFAFQAGAQVGAAHQVHHQREVGAVHDEVADADDVRVVQGEQRGALLDEAADEVLVGGEVLAQQLDGHRALGALAEPHGARRPPPEHLVGGVTAADLPGQDCSDSSDGPSHRLSGRRGAARCPPARVASCWRQSYAGQGAFGVRARR